MRGRFKKSRNNITATIYGSANVGKTSLALTADRPCIFDFDGNLKNATNRQGIPSITVRDWEDVANPEQSDFEGMDTIIVDTVGAAIESVLRGC